MFDYVFVTGVPRSGTSLTTGIIKDARLFTGNAVDAKVRHAWGELRAVTDGIVKPYLMRAGVDPKGQAGLEFENRKMIDVPSLRKDVEAEFVKQGAREGDTVMYKCCKAPLHFELWDKHFPEAKWVRVHRDIESNADSLERTNFMRDYSPFSGWVEWVENYYKYLDLIPDEKRFDFSPSKWKAGDDQHAKDMCDFIGGEYTPTSRERINNKWYNTAVLDLV